MRARHPSPQSANKRRGLAMSPRPHSEHVSAFRARVWPPSRSAVETLRTAVCDSSLPRAVIRAQVSRGTSRPGSADASNVRHASDANSLRILRFTSSGQGASSTRARTAFAMTGIEAAAHGPYVAKMASRAPLISSMVGGTSAQALVPSVAAAAVRSIVRLGAVGRSRRVRRVNDSFDIVRGQESATPRHHSIGLMRSDACTLSIERETGHPPST